MLFFSAYNAPFVQKDIQILRKEYSLESACGNKLKKSIWNYLLIFWGSMWQIQRSDLIYCWFADYRARTGVFWSKFFRKKCAVVIGGYEVKALLYDNVEPKAISSHFYFILKNADLIINVSDHYQKRLCEIFPQFTAKMVRIYNGIEINQQGMEILKKEKLVLTVCSGNTAARYMEKGIDLFIKAAQNLPAYQFVIIGPEGNLKEKIAEKINSDNLVIIPPMAEESLNEWYQKTKVYCQFSRNESFGLAVVEAMSWQCVPVVSSLPSMEERIGDTGFVLETRDIQEAVDKIEMAMNAVIEKGKEAADRVEVLYDIKIREQQLITKLKDLIDEH